MSPPQENFRVAAEINGVWVDEWQPPPHPPRYKFACGYPHWSVASGFSLFEVEEPGGAVAGTGSSFGVQSQFSNLPELDLLGELALCGTPKIPPIGQQIKKKT